MKTQTYKWAMCLGMALTLAVSQVSALNLIWDGDGDGAWSGSNWWNNSAGENVYFTTGTAKVGSVTNKDPGTITFSDMTGLAVGQLVYGPQVTNNQLITGINVNEVALSATTANVSTNQTYFITNDDLVFNGRGAGRAVTVSGSQFASSLTISANGYTFSGGTISLNKTGASIALNATVSTTTTFNSHVISRGVQAASGVNTNQVLIFNGGGQFNGDIGWNNAATTYTTVILNSGSYAAGQYIKIGNVNNTDTGLIVKEDATLQLGGLFWIGYGYNAMVSVKGGLMKATTSVIIGRSNIGRVLVESGTFQVTENPTTNPISNSAGGITVAYKGTGILDIVGTGVVNTHFLAVARSDNAGDNTNGTVNISGGTANVYNTLYFGGGYGGVSNVGNATANLNVSGGILKIGQGGIASVATGGNFNYNVILSGGTVSTTGTAGWSSSLNMTLSNTAGGVTFLTDKDIALSGVLSGGGNFTKAGAGTLLLSGANTYNGDAVIMAGALEVDSSLTLGTLTFVLDGAATGIASGAGTLNLNAIAFDMTNAGDLGSWDMTSIFDGALTVNFASGFNISGWTTSDNSLWTSGDGLYSYDLLSKTISTIPEPSALALMVTGGALLLFLRRKR